jgi:hypothetical protein
LPRQPFISGTFTFPFSSAALMHTVVLSVWTMAATAMATTAIALGATEDAPTAFKSAMFLAGAVLVTVMWFAFASECALTIVRDTANGCDKIPAWPGLAFIDWILEPLYIFNSLCLSTAPGAGVAWLLAEYGHPNDAVALVGFFFFFPIVLLSLLESNSPLGVISLPVYRTFWTAFSGWAGFYLSTAILLAAAGIVVTAATSAGRFWGAIAANLTFTIVWLIYFRLLGRLAWYCADRTAQAEPEADAAENADTDDSTAQDDGD